MTTINPDNKADAIRETLSVRAFLARIARSSDPTITAWIRVSVVDEIDLPELRWRRFELADPTRGRYGGALWATLLRSTVDKLSSGIGALLPDNDLLGQDGRGSCPSRADVPPAGRPAALRSKEQVRMTGRRKSKTPEEQSSQLIWHPSSDKPQG